LIVTNYDESGYAGNLQVTLTTDETRAGNDGVVLAVAVAAAPIIDGIDVGSAEWGTDPASVALDLLSGEDNGITVAGVRAAFDDDYFYMQVKWTEPAAGSPGASADTTNLFWLYTLVDTIETILPGGEVDTGYIGDFWTRSAGEDQLFICWEIGTVTGWETEGAGAVFDAGAFLTPAAGEVADLWVWRSALTYYLEILADQVIRSASASNPGAKLDNGTNLFEENAGDSLPMYMQLNSPPSGSPAPLWVHERGPFDTTIQWRQNASIPGFVYYAPAGSVADVWAKSRFQDGEWTVELRRARRTGHADDVVF
jgi:hypothetical protein